MMNTGPPEKASPRLDTEATRETTIDGSVYVVRSEGVGKADPPMIRRLPRILPEQGIGQLFPTERRLGRPPPRMVKDIRTSDEEALL
jgi:hypothetical protein